MKNKISKDQSEADSAGACIELSGWMAVRTLEKTYDINLRDHRIVEYSSLHDKGLRDYFNLPHVNAQLHSLGMVSNY
jgi:hypothetical protein